MARARATTRRPAHGSAKGSGVRGQGPGAKDPAPTTSAAPPAVEQTAEVTEDAKPEISDPRPPAPDPSLETLPPPPPVPSVLAIEIPLGPLSFKTDGYVSRHLRVDPLTPRQAETLKRLTLALRAKGESCETRQRRDKLVEDTGHAVRWLLDSIADEEERRR